MLGADGTAVRTERHSSNDLNCLLYYRHSHQMANDRYLDWTELYLGLDGTECRFEPVPAASRQNIKVKDQPGKSLQKFEPLRPFRISTQAFPADKRLAMWRELYGRNIANVDIESIGDAPFHADVTFRQLPGVGIAAGSRSAAHYRVTPELATHGRDIIALAMLRSGVASSTQFGKEVIGGRRQRQHPHVDRTLDQHPALSYFNRTFRRLHGATPSDIRGAARLGWTRQCCPTA
jgi:hypothetical protein